MRFRYRFLITVNCTILIMLITATWSIGHPAQLYRAGGEAVRPAPDGTFFCEAQEFQIVSPGWRAGDWGENYYAATFANTFLSRKAFLGAPAQCEPTEAVLTIAVEESGDYLVLARYEAAYRFETRFTVRIEQAGETVFERVYGARDNLKIWPFRRGLQTEVVWRWGAVENIVWEGWMGDDGETAYAKLQPGIATIRLIAGPQPEDAARRNVDLIMLTRDEDQVRERINNQRLRFNPLDGWLTQAGDVWVKVENTGDEPVRFTAPRGSRTQGWHEHSPYWVHQRNWQDVTVTVNPDEISEWTDVGGTMDTLNDGQWRLRVDGPARLTFGVAAADGSIEPIKTVERPAAGQFALAAEADTRYSRRLRFLEEVITDKLEALQAVPDHGKAPSAFRVYGVPFGQRDDFDDPNRYDDLYRTFIDLFGMIPRGGDFSRPGAYIDWRGMSLTQLEATLEALGPDERANIEVVSLGDEISLPRPRGVAATQGFVEYLQAQGLAPAQIDPEAEGWDAISYNISDQLRDRQPEQFYWSHRYLHHFGIETIKQRTDLIRRYLPNAGVGANFSPHHGGHAHAYLGHVFQWVNCFRQDGMTMPWSEDYIWQVPVGTPQMNAINLDLFRAANRNHPERDIYYYVMAHKPGNTPAMWRRLFFNALGHGMTRMDLYQFQPVHFGYTENHVTGHAMYQVILRTLRELGLYEDIVTGGRVRPARTALWFSETADIWGNNGGSFAAAKRALHVAIRRQGVPLDVIIDDDAIDGVLKDYDVVYLTDANVTRAASEQLAAWVRGGGRLIATAGAGMADEYNRPNSILRDLLGIEAGEIQAPESALIGYIKQDLPFADPLDRVTWNRSGDDSATFPVFGAIARLTPADNVETLGVFDDGSPAILRRQNGDGDVLVCAFLPGLSYFHPAIPRRPVDRGSTDDAMAHFIPTEFDASAGALIAYPLDDVARPLRTSSPLVNANIIESDQGVLIVLDNWSGDTVPGFVLTVAINVPEQSAELGSGGEVTVVRQDGQSVFRFDLDSSGDALILR